LFLFVAGVAGADHADHAFALDDLAVFTSALDGRSDFHFRTPSYLVLFESMTVCPGVHAPVLPVIRAVVQWNAQQSPQFAAIHTRDNTIHPVPPFFKPAHLFFSFFLEKLY
jgi:hypothetical protein